MGNSGKVLEFVSPEKVGTMVVKFGKYLGFVAAIS